jgi:hypothetical protein
MWIARMMRLAIAASVLIFSGCCVPRAALRPPHIDNGISVDVKLYDTAALRAQLGTLSSQLSLISGFDQATLIGRIGALQGSYSNQFALGLQATTMPTPTLGNQTTNGTPSTQNTTYTPTTGAPVPSSPTAGQYNQNQLTTPGQTNTNTNTTTPVTPAPAPLPTAQPAAMPTSFSTSSIDALNEEVQLSYQIVNLQMVLQGALSDDYDASGRARRHVTLGFPINVSAGSRYQDKVAEVSVRVCSPAKSQSTGQPKGTDVDSRLTKPDDLVNLENLPVLQTIIPQQNTFNVAGLVSDAESIGLGGIIANVVNVGLSVGSQHQTYYLMKEKDTVALPSFDGKDQSGYQCPLDPDAPNETQSVTFAWQFRPVLQHSAVEDGIRTTFAQISLPPAEGTGPSGSSMSGPESTQPATSSPGAAPSTPPDSETSPTSAAADSQSLKSLSVIVQSCWREFDPKTGSVGDVVSDSCSVSGNLARQDGGHQFTTDDQKAVTDYITMLGKDCIRRKTGGESKRVNVWCYQSYIPVPLGIDTLEPTGAKLVDNHDGTLTVTVTGTFPQSTRVAIGTAYQNTATAGFENSGRYLRFSANTQLLELYGARLVSADSTLSKDVPLIVPTAWGKAVAFARSSNSTESDFLSRLSKNLNSFAEVQIASPKASSPATDGSESHAAPPAPGPKQLSRYSYLTPSSALTALPKETLPLHFAQSDVSVVFPSRAGIPDQFCPGPTGITVHPPTAKVNSFSDSDVLIELDLPNCLNTDKDMQLPPVVILGGQAFGQYDASFVDYIPNTRFRFHAPRILVASQRHLILKPLLGESVYIQPFELPPVPVVDSISVARATKQTTTYLLAGVYLDALTLSFAARHSFGLDFSSSAAYAKLTVPTPALATLKQVVLDGKRVVVDGVANDAPSLVLTLPDGGSPKESVAPTGASLFGVTLLNAEDPLPDSSKLPAVPTAGTPPTPPVQPPSTSQQQQTPPKSRVVYTVTANDLGLSDSLESAQVRTFSGLTRQLKDNPIPCVGGAAEGAKDEPAAEQAADQSATVLYANHDVLVFALPQAVAKSLQQVVLVLPKTCTAPSAVARTDSGAAETAHPAPPPGDMSPQIYLLDLPKPPTAQTGTKPFKPDKVTIKQNGTGSLTVKGDSVDQIASASYLGTQLPVLISSDGASATIGTLPAMTQQIGTVPIVVRLKDGSRSEVLVDVSK